MGKFKMGRKLIDLTGKTFGRLTVTSLSRNETGTIYWECVCSCGNTKIVQASNLRSGSVTTCGCGKVKDLTGKTFGYLTVLSRAENKGKLICWNCLCICGKKKIIQGYSFSSGKTISCGCYRKKVLTKHGMSKTPEYKAWTSLLMRCYSQKDISYEYYGGRGIKVCERWNKFENFYDDIGDRPSNKHSLDRVDSNGDYCKENCKWSTILEQNCNKRNNNNIIGITLRDNGSYQWHTMENGVRYSGTCKTKEIAATMYDNKNEELGRGRPNKTERK